MRSCSPCSPFPLLAPSAAAAARSEFFGIVQIATLDIQDLQGMSDARVRTDRFVLKWGWVQPNPGSFDWDSADQFIGELAYHRIRAVPSVWGNPAWLAGLRIDSTDRRAAGRGGVADPPPGAGGALRAARHLLGQRLPPAVRPGAEPLPIQSWQIWNEPNLQKYFAPNPSPGKYARLLQISQRRDQEQGPEGTRRARRNAKPRRRGRLGLPQGTSTRWPGSRTGSTPLPCTRTGPRSTSSGRTSRGSAR